MEVGQVKQSDFSLNYQLPALVTIVSNNPRKRSICSGGHNKHTTRLALQLAVTKYLSAGEMM